MTVVLNHTIVPAADHRAAADFFAGIMGLERLEPQGASGHFEPVRVNDSLTLEFMAVEDAQPHHLAFDVDAAEFDAILARIRERGVVFGSSPREPGNGRTDHPLCERGFFFSDESGNLYEVMSA
ncbi:VOC family protein [Saccharopolyspora taberi]|uniref:VOC family protein n=1 Tax=Saccharopolyspora taberi TaxID=60895 RepID=A0ABN3V1G1_9PSEU